MRHSFSKMAAAKRKESKSKSRWMVVRDDLIGPNPRWDLDLNNSIEEPTEEDLIPFLPKLQGGPESIEKAMEKARIDRLEFARHHRSKAMVKKRKERLDALIFKGKSEVAMDLFLGKILPQVETKKERELWAHGAYFNLRLISAWAANHCKVPTNAIDIYSKFIPESHLACGKGCPFLPPLSTSGRISMEDAEVASCIILLFHKLVSSPQFRGALGRSRSTSEVGKPKVEDSTSEVCDGDGGCTG